MKKSTLVFLVTLALGCGMGIFAPIYLLADRSNLSAGLIWAFIVVAAILMLGLGFAAGLQFKRFFFAPIVAPLLELLISIPMLGFIDFVCVMVALVAFGICLISMLITALILYFIDKKRRNNE